MADAGYIKAEQARLAKANPLNVNLRPFGGQVYAADYFAEDVRRTLVANFGEEGLNGRAERGAVGDGRVNGGLAVRTTIDPKLQRLARKALVDGLVQFDRVRGWRGPTKTIDSTGNWGMALADIEVPGELAPWRLGVVLDAQRLKAVVGLRPTRQPDGSLPANRDTVELPFDEVKWARKATGGVAQSRDRRAQGRGRDLGVAQGSGQAHRHLVADAASRDRRWPCRHGPAHGSRARRGRRLLLLRQPVRSRPAGQAAAGVGRSSRSSTRRPSTTATSRPTSCSTSRSRSTWVTARTSGTPKNYDGGSRSGPSTLRLGVEKSRNLMTVRLAQDMGMPMVGEYAKRFGVYDKLLASARHVAGCRRDDPAQACERRTPRWPTAASR